MNKKITNITDNDISLFVKRNDIEEKIDIPAGGEVVTDDYETPTIRVFKKRGLITMESINVAQMMESQAAALLNESVETITLKSSTIDNSVDSNNDEVMDHFHTTETQEVKFIDNPTKLEIVEDEVEQYVEDGYIKGAWSEEDIEFLKKNYPTKGRTFCSVHLNRNESSVQKKINSMSLKKRKKRKK